MNDAQYSDINVLILDDSTFVRSVVKRILSSVGVERIAEAASGERALKYLKESDQDIDIIFCDLMMPDMDGIEFLRHVEGLPGNPAFLFVSGAGLDLLDGVETAAKARNLTVLGSVQKPFTQDAAVRALNAFKAIASKFVAGSAETAPITAEDLRIALDQDQIQLHYQPKVSMTDNSLVGFESLARWEHPKRGFIPPDAFIGAAEKLGMISDVTVRTMTLALRQCA